jgi:hypothetical protein
MGDHARTFVAARELSSGDHDEPAQEMVKKTGYKV